VSAGDSFFGWVGGTSYLIVLVQLLQVPPLDECPRLLITESNAVVEVSQPDDALYCSLARYLLNCKDTKPLTVIFDTPVPLKPQPMVDRGIVLVPLVVVCKARRHVGSHEADGRACVVEAYSNGSLVSGHARQAGLLDTSLDVLDIVKSGGLDEDAERRANKLAAPQKDVTLTADSLGTGVERLHYSFLPESLYRRVAVHDLLWTKLDNFLEANDENLR